MKKLLFNKDFLSLTESVLYLSDRLAESISLADLMQFVLEKKLVLSVKFVNYEPVRNCKILEESKPSVTSRRYVVHKLGNSDESVEVDTNSITHLRGIYGLPLIGGELDSILGKYQSLIGGEQVICKREIGAILQDGKALYELCEYVGGADLAVRLGENLTSDLYEAANLKDEHGLVFKKSSLDKFLEYLLNSSAKQSPEKIIKTERLKGKIF